MICDGCNVHSSWEHRCHQGPPIRVCDELVHIECECPDCNGALA